MTLNKVRLPLTIPVYPYFRDHLFESRMVFPAVEAMKVLASSVSRYAPEVDILDMGTARFEKFLYLEPDETQFAACIDIVHQEDGGLAATLGTYFTSTKSGISRFMEHAVMHYDRGTEKKTPSAPVAAPLSPPVFEVAAEHLYAELVPFGPCFHNIEGILHLSRTGARGPLKTFPDDPRDAMAALLGSPFPLDAAFHAACVWSQRYAGIVAFPVGFAERRVITPTCAGGRYIADVIPRPAEKNVLVFDIWISDMTGRLFETISGVRMRDVSGGRLKPPPWVREGVDH